MFDTYKQRNIYCYELATSTSFECWPFFGSWFEEQNDKVENKLAEYVAYFLMSAPTWRGRVVDARMCPIPTGLDVDSYMLGIKKDDGKIGLIGTWRLNWIGASLFKEVRPGSILFHEETMTEAQKIISEGFSYEMDEVFVDSPVVQKSKLTAQAQKYEDMCDSIPYGIMQPIEATTGRALQNHARRYNRDYAFRVSVMPDGKYYLYKTERES